MQEKRKYPRHKIYTPAHMETFNGGVPVSVVEVSVEGLRLESTNSYPPETHVAIRINAGREIVFHGQVIWVTSAFTDQGHTYMSGIQTDVILDKGEEIIDTTEREILIQEIVILTKST